MVPVGDVVTYVKRGRSGTVDGQGFPIKRLEGR